MRSSDGPSPVYKAYEAFYKMLILMMYGLPPDMLDLTTTRAKATSQLLGKADTEIQNARERLDENETE